MTAAKQFLIGPKKPHAYFPAVSNGLPHGVFPIQSFKEIIGIALGTDIGERAGVMAQVARLIGMLEYLIHIDFNTQTWLVADEQIAVLKHDVLVGDSSAELAVGEHHLMDEEVGEISYDGMHQLIFGNTDLHPDPENKAEVLLYDKDVDGDSN